MKAAAEGVNLTDPERRALMARELNTIRQLVINSAGGMLAQGQADRILRHVRTLRGLLAGREVAASGPRETSPERDELRRRVFALYGSACACCGEDNPRALTIDHVKPLKGKRRKGDIYRKLLNGGAPREAFQVLCLNCNQLKGTGEACPHRSKAA